MAELLSGGAGRRSFSGTVASHQEARGKVYPRHRLPLSHVLSGCRSRTQPRRDSRPQQQLTLAAPAPLGNHRTAPEAPASASAARSAVRLHRDGGRRRIWRGVHTQPRVSRRGARRANRREVRAAPAGSAWSILRVSGARSLWPTFLPLCPAVWRPWVTWVLRRVRARLRRLPDI